MILSEAWQLYKADKQIQGYSSQTLKAYKIQSALFIKHLGNVEIEEITTETFKLYLGEVASDLKASSFMSSHSFLLSRNILLLIQVRQ